MIGLRPQAAADALAAADIVRSPDNLPDIESAVFRCVVIHWTSEIKDYKTLWAAGQAKEADREGGKLSLVKATAHNILQGRRENMEHRL